MFSSPISEYFHDKGRCSITGGYVYRGRTLSNLVGTYVYGDFCSGEIFALNKGEAVNDPHRILKSSLQISSFGEDAAGELYVLDYKGGVYRLAPP
jgi:hypothetical protein